MTLTEKILAALLSALITVILSFLGYIFAKVKSEAKKAIAQRKATQALLRDRLYAKYDHCREKGYADMDDRNNFENIYINYHTLGQNGVMDDIRKRFLALPDKPLKGKRR